jgi:hypothetical protein
MNARTKISSSLSVAVRSTHQDCPLNIDPRFQGGGGTFGVVTEATILASPPVKLQSLILALKAPTATKRMWSILADNALKWADEGWGGFSTSQVVILINPKLSSQEARESLAPLIDFGRSLPADEVELDITEFPTWGAFFDVFTKDHVAVSLRLKYLSSFMKT